LGDKVAHSFAGFTVKTGATLYIRTLKTHSLNNFYSLFLGISCFYSIIVGVHFAINHVWLSLPACCGAWNAPYLATKSPIK